MKRTIAIAIMLCALCRASFAVILFVVEAPKDAVEARAGVCSRPELEPLHATYNDIIQTRLQPLKRDDVAKVFGPKIEAVENRTGSGLKLPTDLVLPIFAPAGGSNCTGAMMMMVSGLVAQNDHSHTDLHAIGDIGYVEFYYQWDGNAIATALVYFRADDKFVPLTTTFDFAKRLEWERGKFDALKKWLDQHMPRLTELGLVEVSESSPRRLAALGQRNFTNDVSTTAAIKVVSQLKVGLQEEEARKVLATNGLPIFASSGRPGRWFDIYLLSDGKRLMLSYSAPENISNDGPWKGRLSSAGIQGNVGDAGVLINLLNAPINALGVPGGVAEIYHLDVDNPSAEDRAQLARDFQKFTPENQYLVLARLWPRVRCPEFAGVLLPLAKPPIESERENADTLCDEVFIRLLELKPEAVRPLILEDLRRKIPLFSLGFLRALPDKELPELDDVLLANLGHNEAIWKEAPLIERYASARILPQVIVFYNGKEGSWACVLQTAFLRYWLKHDRPSALQAIERAVNMRYPARSNYTRCYISVLGETLRDSFDADAEQLVRKFINDSDPDVAADAKKLLSQHTSAAVPN